MKSKDYASLAGSLATVAIAALGGPLPAAATAGVTELVNYLRAFYEKGAPTRDLQREVERVVLARVEGSHEFQDPESGRRGLAEAAWTIARYGVSDQRGADFGWDPSPAAAEVIAAARANDRFWGSEEHYALAEEAIRVTYKVLYRQVKASEPLLIPAIRSVRGDIDQIAGQVARQLQAQGEHSDERFDTLEARLHQLDRLAASLVDVSSKVAELDHHMNERFDDLEHLVNRLQPEGQPREAQTTALEGRPSALHQVDRPELEVWLDHALTLELDANGSGGSWRIALHGAGGAGKSMLASRVADQLESLGRFPDGTYWISLHARPLVSMQLQLSRSLGIPAEFADWPEGQQLLKRNLADRRCLLILDDVTSQSQLDAFDVLGHRGATLFTTRDAALAASNAAESRQVGPLSPAEARALLAAWAVPDGSQLPPLADNVLTHCEGLALALAMCGAYIRRQPEEDRWLALIRNLELAKLQRISAPLPGYKVTPSLLAAIDVCVENLNQEGMGRGLPNALDRYCELAALRGRGHFLRTTAAALWAAQGSDPLDAGDYLVLFCDQSLATVDESGQISVHDLFMAASSQRIASRLTTVHRGLVEQYRAASGGKWASGPDDDGGYYFRNLVHHMHEAGAVEELQDLLVDARWIQAKLHTTDPQSLLDDYQYASENSTLRELGEALELSASALTADPGQLASQLHGRLGGRPDPALKRVVSSSADAMTGAWLRPRSASLGRPGGFIQRFLTTPRDGEQPTVIGSAPDVAISGDGRTIARRSYFYRGKSVEEQVHLWDIATLSEPRSIRPAVWLGHFALTPDGTELVSAYGPGKFTVSDTQSGAVKVRFQIPLNPTVLVVEAHSGAIAIGDLQGGGDVLAAGMAGTQACGGVRFRVGAGVAALSGR